MLNVILLFMCATSGACATAGTFGHTLDIDQLNKQSSEARFALSQEQKGTRVLLTVKPIDSDKNLTIDMEDLDKCNPCHVALYKEDRSSPVAQATITLSTVLDAHEHLELEVCSLNENGQWQQYASLSFFTNHEKIKKPEPTATLANEHFLQVTYNLNTDSLERSHFLLILIDLNDPYEFLFSSKTKCDDTSFALAYDAFSTAPAVIHQHS